MTQLLSIEGVFGMTILEILLYLLVIDVLLHILSAALRSMTWYQCCRLADHLRALRNEQNLTRMMSVPVEQIVLPRGQGHIDCNRCVPGEHGERVSVATYGQMPCVHTKNAGGRVGEGMA